MPTVEAPSRSTTARRAGAAPTSRGAAPTSGGVGGPRARRAGQPGGSRAGATPAARASGAPRPGGPAGSGAARRGVLAPPVARLRRWMRGSGLTARGDGRTDVWDSPVASYYLVAGVTTLLLLLGLVMVLSSSTIASIKASGTPYAVFLDQAKYALIGVPLLVVASRLPVRVYRRLAWPGLVLALGLQMLIFTPLARGRGGNVNWIYLPGLNQTVQPSEFLKLALVVWLAAVLAAKRHLLGRVRHVLVPGGIVAALALGLILSGRDLGTALIVVVLVAGTFFAAGVPLWVFTIAGGLAAAGIAALTLTSENRIARVQAFLGMGDLDPQGTGFQTLHGLWGLGTGGLSGVGLGASREKWLYLPEAHNDFIFAIIGEELGLLGTLLVLGLFGALAVGLHRILRRHPDPFVQIATAGVAAWLLMQALVNIGVVIGVLPVIGIPLPLLSAGGSALITTLVALGMILAFARSEPGAAQALEARRRAVRRSLAVVARRGRRG